MGGVKMKIENIQLTKNFNLKEFGCKDGSEEIKLDMDLVTALQKLRDFVSVPITIMSGYRNEAYNKKIGGSPNSQHLYGKAADIHIMSMEPEEIYYLVVRFNHIFGFTGIGLYDSFVHLDVRSTPSKWDLRKKDIKKPFIFET